MAADWNIVRQRPGKKQKQRRVYVSLNRRGEFAFNAEAFRLIGQPASVTLLYDAPAKRFGIKFPVAIDRHFFPVRSHGRGRRTLIVRAARMLKQFGIEVERTVVFKNIAVASFNGDPMLVLEMEKSDHEREMDRLSESRNDAINRAEN